MLKTHTSPIISKKWLHNAVIYDMINARKEISLLKREYDGKENVY